MYKDYNNYNSLNNNLMIYLARLDIEFNKIKFFPNLQDLTDIKNNLKYLNFEDFSSYINNVESNLMKLFKSESENTINEFDSLINELKELRYKFISSLDLKMVKINSMFVIIKMVFYLMYKDYNNYNSLNNNLMIYLARLDIEFDKIKFFPNLQDLTEIKNNLKNFEKNLNSNKIFNVDYIFKKYENKTEFDWKLIKKINLNKKTKFNLITSILQLNNNLNKLFIFDKDSTCAVLEFNEGKVLQIKNMLLRNFDSERNGAFFWEDNLIIIYNKNGRIYEYNLDETRFIDKLRIIEGNISYMTKFYDNLNNRKILICHCEDQHIKIFG
jgi:hypothetical protein